MAKWLDRNVYTQNLIGNKDSPDGKKSSATDQPGLKQMTLKAIDILQARSSDKGWVLMSEAASIDKQMHTLDYDRALGELLELDDTIKATLAHLDALGTLNNTLVIVTADHGHGFDVMGSVDTKYLAAQTTDRSKRGAIGTYQNSGLSQYTDANSETGPMSNSSSHNNTSIRYTNGTFFPANWDPRYTLFSAIGADPDRRENYEVHKDGPRVPAVNITGFPSNDYYFDYKDAVSGFIVNGTLPVNDNQGVHSLTDVPVFARGPCQEMFGECTITSTFFFGMADCLGLARART
ncbi:hypothetical protein N7G274_010810 [Stereocaulon virgatum]|uniref:alkaline phosphatase n=1 Tax=Stereocaulon virgatum TaxID=373712 RepID=A0ABR3ZTV5_9LECA